ncbi:MAG: hypothetical protein DWQ19_10810 [Crenarchaeota archaeon]|nr:MAG: hypothetical protein DWQ19_10810 [Thermoproteota archaeon]
MNKEKFLSEEEFSSVLDSRFTRYAFMSLEDRALPDARDGLKPSQRRVLVAMNDLHLSSTSVTEKSAKICGDTSGNYHPHGEAVVYPTMYRLAQPWVMRYPLLIGQGNFGNVDGDPPAAMRYTEAKLSQMGEAMLRDLSEDVVAYESNYNEKRKEPTILPAFFPNLLANGCEGIAVGWATKMLPHNIKELAAIVKKYISNPNTRISSYLKLMPGPDFPTGGKILGQQGVLDYYTSGRGTIKVEGTYAIDKKSIVVTELPYQSSPDQLCNEIKNLVESGKIDGIVDLKNLSSKKTGINVVIQTGKGSNVPLILNGLLKHTCLRKSISVNQTVLIDGKVVPEASLPQLIKAFVDHRKEVLVNKYQAELKCSLARVHILEGLIGIVDKIDAVIELIRNSDDPEDAEKKLIFRKFVKTLEQAKAVLSITLRQLTKLEGKKLLEERDKLKKRIKWLKKVVADEKEILALIVQEQNEIIKDFGDDRKTEMVEDVEEISEEDLIKDENLTITLTGNGYIKAFPAGKTPSLEDAFVVLNTKSKDSVLFLTNTGFVYQRMAYLIPQDSRMKKGLHVSSLLDLKVDEKVVSMFLLEEKSFVLIVTKNGVIKRSESQTYETTRTNGIGGINLNKGDEVVFAGITDGKKDIFIVTKHGYLVRYSEEIVPVQGRLTKGSRALKMDYEDDVAAVFTLDPKDISDILVITENGFGKRNSNKDYKCSNNRQIRGSSIVSKTSLRKTGDVVGACLIDKNDILILTDIGIFRIGPSSIRQTTRNANGRLLVKLESGQVVTKIAQAYG